MTTQQMLDITEKMPLTNQQYSSLQEIIKKRGAKDSALQEAFDVLTSYQMLLQIDNKLAELLTDWDALAEKDKKATLEFMQREKSNEDQAQIAKISASLKST